MSAPGVVESTAPSRRSVSLPLLLAGGGALVLAAAAGVLWVKFGATVFYEMIAAGIALCF